MIVRRLIAVAVLSGLALWAAPAPGQSRFLNRTAREWMDDLGAADAKVRRNAAFALGKLGRDADSTLDRLQQCLKEDNDATVREAAAFALGEIGQVSLKSGGAAGLVTQLTDALKDKAPLVRRSAAYALGCLGEQAAPAVGALAAAVGDEKPGVRQNAAWALGRLGGKEAMPPLRKALVDSDAVVRRDAAAAVGQFQPELARDALAELVECCNVKDSEVRKAALAVLAKIVGPEDKNLAAGIREMLKDTDAEVRRNAAFVLANVGGDAAAAALPLLLDALNRGEDEVRRQAAAALSNLGPAGGPAVPDLLKALVAPDDKLRAYAAMALGGIGDKAERAVPDLVKLIGNRQEQPDVRIEAATALSRIGEVPAARKAVPQLVNVLQDANDNAFVLQGNVKVLVRERVIWSLRVHNARLRDFPEVLAAFAKILSESRQSGVKMLYYDSAYMLGMLKGPEAPAKTIDELAEFLKDDSIQIYVGKEAKSVGGGAESPADLKVRETGMGDGRIMAVQALGRIGPRVADRKDIVRQLQAIERDERLWGRLRTETKDLLKELGR